MGKKGRLLAMALFCCLFTQLSFAAGTATIGTGGKTGVYYPVGREICHLVNMTSGKYGFRYEAKASNGSCANINYVLKGDLEIGFAQSDRQYEAYNGLADWHSAGPQKDLRSVFSIYYEAITLIVAQKIHATSLDGLKGKRVNIGNRGSGQHRNALDVLNAVGISSGEFSAKESSMDRLQELMRDNTIDGFFYTVGHPNNLIGELSKNMDIAILPITGPGIDALIGKYPYYTRTRIPMGLYPAVSNRSDVDSIGVTATLITSRKINNHVIYALVKGVFENLNGLKNRHPALRNISKQEMLKGLSAPIHEGALAYYREAGLIR